MSLVALFMHCINNGKLWLLSSYFLLSLNNLQFLIVALGPVLACALVPHFGHAKSTKYKLTRHDLEGVQEKSNLATYLTSSDILTSDA
jgi:hypothetical protein